MGTLLMARCATKLMLRCATNRTRGLVPRSRHAWLAVLLAIAGSLGLVEAGQAADESSDDPAIDKASLSKLLDVARDELQAARLSEKEVQLRLRIVENVAMV